MLMSAMSLYAGVKVDRIEPTNWYVGMKDASLQLMVYGKDVRNAAVEVNYPGVRIDSIARLDSPNYLLVYLNLEGAKAGEMTLTFKQGKQTQKVKYQLKERAMAGDKRIGFTATVATLREYASTSTISPNLASRRCGSRPYSRTTAPAMAPAPPTTATPRPTIIASTRASEPMRSISVSSTRPTARD